MERGTIADDHGSWQQGAQKISEYLEYSGESSWRPFNSKSFVVSVKLEGWCLIFNLLLSLDLPSLTPSQDDWNIESSSWKLPAHEAPPPKAQFFTRQCFMVQSIICHFEQYHWRVFFRVSIGIFFKGPALPSRSVNWKLLVALFSICPWPGERKLTL